MKWIFFFVLWGFCLSLFKFVCDNLCICYSEAGASEEKGNLWETTQKEVWDARRLWMGRRVTGMAWRRKFLPVVWKPWLQHLSWTQTVTLLLFLGGSQNLKLPLVIISYLNFSSFLRTAVFIPFTTIHCFIVWLLSFTGKSGGVVYFNNPMWPGECYSCVCIYLWFTLWDRSVCFSFFFMFGNWNCKLYCYSIELLV